MLEWDERKGILYAYKHSLARPDLFPENNTTVYNSFNEYINGIVQKDVQNEFIPAIEKIMLHNGGISVCPEDIRVIEPELKGYFPDKSRLVQVKFLVPKTTSEPEWITIMRIPDVGEDNVLQINGKKYAFINMLEQEPSISFKIDKGEMRLKLINGLQSLSIVSTKSGVKVEFSKMKSLSGAVKKYDILQIIFALAKYEGFDPRAVFDEYSSYAVTQQADIDDGINLEQRMANIIGTASIKASEYENELVPMLKLFAIDFMNRNVEAYSNVSIRNRINKLLSMDMALDRVLAKDVYSTLNEGKLVAKAGQVVTSVMLNDFDVEGVYKIDVTIEPQIEGNYLAEDVYIFDLRKGIKVCDIIREAIPSEANNMYLSKDYNYKEFANGFPILLQSKTEITKDIINILLNYGVTQVLISDKPTGGSKHVYRFYEEIISNRQFKRQFGGTLQWCYLDAQNNFVPNDGSYTTYDFAALLSYCIKLFSDRYTDRVVDVDKGFRKRLVPLSEQYHKAFVWACYKAFDQMKDSLRNTYKGDMTTFMHADMIENKFYPFTKNFLAYLRDEVRCLEELTTDNIHNPVAYISACTKANVFVKSKHAVSDQQRDIAVGSYGKIDPYEVPQSGKLGVASHLCCDTRISEADEVLEDGTIICKGSMQTAYYGLVHKGTITKIDLDNKVWLTAEQEEQYVIADICSIDFDENNCCADNTKLVQCRVPNSKFNEKSTFAYKHISEVEYVNCSAQQSLGWASATIPFIASNDAARAIFAVAQMKQGKGLINPEEPDVLTSAWEQIPVINNKFCFIAKKPGEVYSCVYDRTRSKYSLQLLYMDGTSEQIEYPVFLNSGISVTKFNILVDEGDTFDKGDVLVSSNFISKNGIMTLGINALVGYICDGWNYEDGAHISETLSSKLASYRINSEVIEGKPEVDYEFRIGSQINTSYSRPGACSVDVSFKTKVGTTVATHTHVRTIKKAYGFYEYQENVHGQKPTNKNRVTGVKLNFVSVDKFGVGDKISNRHGNKGVISVVSPTADMPRLKNGMPLELCLNPLGVGSRMNIGQIKELHSGLITHICGFKLSADAYNSISDQELAELLSLVYDLANSTDDGDAAFNKHNDLFAFMKNGYEFREFLRDRLDYIRLYAGCFEEDGTAYVELPTNDGKLAKVRIPVGYLYIYKLTQEVEEKFHVRGGQNNNSKYTKIAKAPTEGAHNGGGQRLGTMEMDALCAYGVSSYIHELVNERADNAIARSNFIADTFLPKNRASEFKRPNGRPQRRAVTQFLYSMLSLGIMMEPTEKESIFSQEFVPLSKQNSEQCVAVSSKALNRVGTKAEGSIRFRDQDISMPTHYARDLMIQDMEEGDEDAIEVATEEDLHIEHPGQDAGDMTNGPMSLFEAASKTDTSKDLKSVLLKKKE